MLILALLLLLARCVKIRTTLVQANYPLASADTCYPSLGKLWEPLQKILVMPDGYRLYRLVEQHNLLVNEQYEES